MGMEYATSAIVSLAFLNVACKPGVHGRAIFRAGRLQAPGFARMVPAKCKPLPFCPALQVGDAFERRALRRAIIWWKRAIVLKLYVCANAHAALQLGIVFKRLLMGQWFCHRYTSFPGRLLPATLTFHLREFFHRFPPTVCDPGRFAACPALIEPLAHRPRRETGVAPDRTLDFVFRGSARRFGHASE